MPRLIKKQLDKIRASIPQRHNLAALPSFQAKAQLETCCCFLEKKRKDNIRPRPEKARRLPDNRLT